MTNPTAGNIHANYPGWIFRLNVPTNFVDRIGSNNDSSSRSEDENGDNLEGVQLLDDKNPTDNYGLSTFSSSGLRYLAELCPHGVSVTALPIDESKCNTKSKNSNANRTKSKIEQNEQAETNWSWSFSSQSSPSQWNVTSSNLLSVTYRPAHEAYPSYTNISKKKEAWHRSVGACFEKGGWACRHALRGKMCGSSDSNVAGKVQPQKKRSHRWSKMKRIMTGSPKPIHRMKVNYSVDDILFMEPMIAAPTPPDSESSSLLENEADAATKRGLWIRGVGYCHALRIYLRPKFGAYSPNANNDGDNELLDSTNSRDHNAGFELPPMDSWDNLPSPPWETLNGEAKGQQKNTHKGPILTFAIPFQQTSTSSSGNDEQKPMSIDKCPPLLWKVDHPPNPHVAIDSLSLLEGKLHLHQHKAKQAKSSSSSTSYHYDAPTNVYINGYQSWSYSGSVAQGEVQPTSAMPKVLSEAFNRGGVVLSSSSRYSVESTEDADDCWNENVGLDSEAMDSKSSIDPNDEEELNEETAFYKSDFFACISSNGATATQLNGERILLDEEGGPALIVGFLSQRHQFGAVLMDKGLRRFNLVACHEGVVAAPSSKSTSALNGRQSLTTDWAYCQIVDSSCYDEESMVYYVHASGDHNDARPMEKGLTAGWCSWYHYYSDIDHDSLSKNAHILERHQSNIGFNVCLIDDGYMTSWGDWTSLKPGKFLKDGGMRVLADTIRSKGMKPGVWLAPFACDKSSKLAKDHPDWIIRNDKGRIANSANCGKYFYGLDATHPGVRRHVYETIRRAVEEWGFEVLKLDFLYASCLVGNGKYDVTMSRAEAMHLGLRTIRAAAGNDTFIIGCGCPIGSAIGFVDGMRVSCDTGPTWYPEFPLPWWDNGTLPALRGMLRNTISRAPMGHRWWHNDPDCILLGESTKLTDNEVVSAASIVAMTGGMFLLSDDMEKVSEARLSVAKKIFPLTGITAVPLDLHSTLNAGMPSTLRLWCTEGNSEDGIVGVEKAKTIPAGRILREQASKLEYEVGPVLIVDPYSRERSCFAVAPGLGTWTVVSLSNWMEHSATLSVSFSALVGHSYQDFLATQSGRTGENRRRGSDTPGEKSESGFHIFEFWSSKYAWIPHQTLVDNNPLIKKLAPHETEIFHIKPANPTRPQYIGSDLHFSCGFEVRSFVFGEGHVSICLKNDYEKKGSIYLYLPGSDESLNTVAVTANGKPVTAAVVAKPNIGVHTEGSNQPTHFYQGRVLQVRVSIEASGAENDGKVSFTW